MQVSGFGSPKLEVFRSNIFLVVTIHSGQVLAAGCTPGALWLPPYLWGQACARAPAHARFFAARHEVMLQLMRVVNHCQATLVRCPQTVARIRPSLVDHFLMDYYLRTHDGGPPLLPDARRPPRAPPSRLPLAVVQRSRPLGRGRGTRCELCMAHRAPSCALCKRVGWGIGCCCHALLEGHCGPVAGPGMPARPTKGRGWLPAPRSTCATRGSSGAIRLAVQAAPRPPVTPGHMAPGDAPMRGASQDIAPPLPPLALGPEGSRPPKEPNPDLPPN